MGLLMLMVGLIYPGDDAAWGDFQTTLARGIDNPFPDQFLSYRYTAIANGTILPDSTTGCSASDWFECVEPPRNDETYLSLTVGTDSVSFDVNTIGGTQVVTTLVYKMVARNQVASQTRWSAAFLGTSDANSDNQFFTSTNFISTSTSRRITSDIWATIDGGEVVFTTFNAADGVDISYVEVEVWTVRQPPCTGTWFDEVGCQIGRFFEGIINTVVLIANSIAFVGQVLFTFIVGILAISLWFYTIPGAPSLVTAVSAVIFTALLGYVFIALVKIIRGGGP